MSHDSYNYSRSKVQTYRTTCSLLPNLHTTHLFNCSYLLPNTDMTVTITLISNNPHVLMKIIMVSHLYSLRFWNSTNSSSFETCSTSPHRTIMHGMLLSNESFHQIFCKEVRVMMPLDSILNLLPLTLNKTGRGLIGFTSTQTPANQPMI